MYNQSVVETEEQSLQGLQWLKSHPDTNRIFNTVSKVCNWPVHRDSFSVKFAFSGTETYRVHNNRIPIRQQRFLVVNEGQPYSGYVRSDEWVATFVLYVNRSFLNQTLAAYTTPEDVLLSNPNYSREQDVWFFEQVYTATTSFFHRVTQLKRTLEISALSDSELEEYLHGILAELFLAYKREVARKTETLSSVKPATRMELYRRLHLAKEFIDDQVTTVITLDDMAQAAMLSKNHLLKHFKQMFRQSPHQYLISKRLERAKESLLSSDLPVNQIVLQTGFECPSAFGRLFKSSFALTPQQYRLQYVK